MLKIEVPITLDSGDTYTVEPVVGESVTFEVKKMKTHIIPWI